MDFFKRLGFKKADERDIQIHLYATRIQWFFVTLVLIVWTIYDLIKKGTLTLPFFVWMGGQFFYSTALFYFNKKMSGSNEE